MRRWDGRAGGREQLTGRHVALRCGRGWRMAEGGGLDAAPGSALVGCVPAKMEGVLEFSQSGQHSLSGEIDCLCRVRCILHAPSGHDAAHRRALESGLPGRNEHSNAWRYLANICASPAGHGEPKVVLSLGTSPESRDAIGALPFCELVLWVSVWPSCQLSCLLDHLSSGIRLLLVVEQVLEVVSGRHHWRRSVVE